MQISAALLPSGPCAPRRARAAPSPRGIASGIGRARWPPAWRAARASASRPRAVERLHLQQRRVRPTNSGRIAERLVIAHHRLELRQRLRGFAAARSGPARRAGCGGSGKSMLRDLCERVAEFARLAPACPGPPARSPPWRGSGRPAGASLSRNDRLPSFIEIVCAGSDGDQTPASSPALSKTCTRAHAAPPQSASRFSASLASGKLLQLLVPQHLLQMRDRLRALAELLERVRAAADRPSRPKAGTSGTPQRPAGNRRSLPAKCPCRASTLAKIDRRPPRSIRRATPECWRPARKASSPRCSGPSSSSARALPMVASLIFEAARSSAALLKSSSAFGSPLSYKRAGRDRRRRSPGNRSSDNLPAATRSRRSPRPSRPRAR